ncbi:MAG: hypothetical protein KBF76_21055 [Verrucomicrobiales bacterium]|nr:hypothetical protein [Verrucomicrobiales bacterium]
MKYLALIVFLWSILVSSAVAEPYEPPDTSGDPLEVTRQLYIDLHAFKDDPKFHEVGFAPSKPETKYQLWHRAFKRANEDPRYGPALIAKGIAIGDLYTLGMDYMKSKGQPTDYSKFITAEFLRALKRD